MTKPFVLALVLAMGLGHVVPVRADAPLRPASFRHQAAITTGSGGPFHRLSLPFEVYQGVRHPDLGDLRVFNGRGEMLPYTLLRTESQIQSREHEHAVPFFPLPAVPAATDAVRPLAVTVRQAGDGTLVAVQVPVAGKAAGTVRGIVIDASKLRDKAVRSLRLNVEPGSVPFHSYVLESSDDLRHWRVLKGDAQLVHLNHEGHQIVDARSTWHGDADRYLRLLWNDPLLAPAIRAVHLGVVETTSGRPVEIWSSPLLPEVAGNNVYDYLLPGHLPLEKLSIDLPQINTLAPVDIQRLLPARTRRAHRHRGEAHWETLSRSVVYRLQSPLGEIRSPDIALFRAPEARLRLVTDARAGGMGSGSPVLRVGFVPHVLVFLARGEGPYVLAWGADAVASGALPAAMLLPGYEGVHKLTASAATLVVAAKLPATTARAEKKEPVEAAQVSSKWMLWGVMLLGLLVLGGMARALLGQLRQGTGSGE